MKIDMLEFSIKHVATTRQKRNIYTQGMCYNMVDLIMNDISIVQIENEINKPGGCILYTHQRDNGYIIWYPIDKLTNECILNINGCVLYTFYL